MSEEWKKEFFEWKDEIESKYNDLSESKIKCENKIDALEKKQNHDYNKLLWIKMIPYKEWFWNLKMTMDKQIADLKEQIRLEVDMRVTNTKTLNRFLNDWTSRTKNNREVLRELNQIVKGIAFDMNKEGYLTAYTYIHYKDRLQANEEKLDKGSGGEKSVCEGRSTPGSNKDRGLTNSKLPEFKCPHCQTRISLETEFECPNCSSEITLKEMEATVNPKCPFCGRDLIWYEHTWICGHGCTKPAVEPKDKTEPEKEQMISVRTITKLQEYGQLIPRHEHLKEINDLISEFQVIFDNLWDLMEYDHLDYENQCDADEGKRIFDEIKKRGG